MARFILHEQADVTLYPRLMNEYMTFGPMMISRQIYNAIKSKWAVRLMCAVGT